MIVHHVISGLFAFVVANGSQLPHSDSTVTIFIAEVLLMLLVGRLLGELLHRFGQPAVLGQLLAGILLGPTVLGSLWPAAHQLIFPNTPEQKKMIDAISQLGILMLLLIAGMETDFGIVRRMRRTALFSSLSGIVFPFACGLFLGEMLPDSMLPEPEKRIITSLFLATALSISSVKIVAMVIMEVDFMRRNIGQLILASAIIDDTIGWIILAMISGIAAAGTLNIKGVSFTVAGTLIFLALSFTFGRRIVAHVIRWTNDNLRIDFAVLSAILVLMCLMSLVTELIGVHTVLGAFVVGILVGQSPILTKQIHEQIRGLIIALFAPIFFAVAGLSVDLTILKHLYLIELAIGLIMIASLGKLVGCYIGGRLGLLSSREATALAIGMNARGTTEIIVASIGLSIGVVSQDLYTLIVLMAVTTTMLMPPSLRWALARIPPTGEEKERLEREQAEKKEFVPKVERLLIAADQSENGKLASILGGLFAGSRRIIATVLNLGMKEHTTHSVVKEKIEDWVKLSIDFATGNEERNSDDETKTAAPPAQLNPQSSTEEPSVAVLNEVKKGYDMVFVGLEQALPPTSGSTGDLNTAIEKIVRDFKGSLAIVVAKDKVSPDTRMQSLNILVPTSGAEYSRRAGEVAIAIAKACRCGVTAMYVYPPQTKGLFMRRIREHLEPARAVVQSVQELGNGEGVSVNTIIKVRREPEPSIIKQIKKGKHNLVVLGVNARPGEKVFFGPKARVLLDRVPCSVLLIVTI